MRYIKSINELIKNEYYEELTEDEFTSNSKLMEEDWLNKSEFKKITSLVEDLNPLESEVGYSILKDNTGLNFRWKLGNTIADIGHRAIELKKYEDNWFLVEIRYYNLYTIDGKVVPKLLNANTKYFKCDQLEALLKLIRDIIGEIFTKVESPKESPKKERPWWKYPGSAGHKIAFR